MNPRGRGCVSGMVQGQAYTADYALFAEQPAFAQHQRLKAREISVCALFSKLRPWAPLRVGAQDSLAGSDAGLLWLNAILSKLGL